MSIQKKSTDQRSRAFWNFARDVSKEVEAWPTWKRQALVSFRADVSHTTAEGGQEGAKSDGSSTSATRAAKTRKDSARRKSTAVVNTTKKNT